jgi:hypothetical protein
MTRVRIASAVALAAIVSGCATESEAPRSTKSSSLVCEDAISQGVGFGEGEARAVAAAGVHDQTSDIRGYLVSQGIHRVRATERSVTCRPHAFGGGLVKCTAITRYCGR